MYEACYRHGANSQPPSPRQPAFPDNPLHTQRRSRIMMLPVLLHSVAQASARALGLYRGRGRVRLAIATGHRAHAAPLLDAGTLEPSGTWHCRTSIMSVASSAAPHQCPSPSHDCLSPISTISGGPAGCCYCCCYSTMHEPVGL